MSVRSQQETAVRAGSPKTSAPALGVTPSAQCLVAEALHGKQGEAPAISAPAAAADEKRGQATGAPAPRLSGKDTLMSRGALDVDLRLWLICVYAFLIAINNTSLRPVLPSFVKARP